MGFLAQVWIGIRKELSVYKNNPRLLVAKTISILVSIALTVITGRTNSSNLESALITNAIWQILLYYMPARMTLDKISTEKENNFKEYLMVNGMSKAAYQAKIIASNYIEITFFSLSQTIGLYFTYQQYFVTWTVVFQLFFVLLFGGFAVINTALYLSTRMGPQTAPSVGSMLILIPGLLYFAAVSIEAEAAYIIFSFHPTAGLSLAINSLIAQNRTSIKWDGYDGNAGLGILIASSAIFLGLYLFRERDTDNDKKKSRNKTHQNIFAQHDAQDNQPFDPEHQSNQDYASAVHYEKVQAQNVTKTIEALHITKAYPECIAVDDISFSIYQKEIFCLLGHNGAGKTTLVNILTGLIPKTEGAFFYNGEEVYSDLKKIRGSIGFCPQKDFLLMENTVSENLHFFSEIKGIPPQQIDTEINRVMTKLGLQPFKAMQAKKLSGGFKRKLNVGIALLGNPKIIIMDEPTSGMDPVSRRNFWSIIKDLKNENKTVILTTQFIDEAEELSDRVAILASGKLFALGSPEFIKKKFGTGYNLIIQDNEGSAAIKNRADEILSKIQSIIPTAYHHEHTNDNILQYTLPFNEQSNFSKLFEELEKVDRIQMNLQIVSLEEAFVNLGANPSKAINKKPEQSGEKSPSKRSKTIPACLSRDRTPSFSKQVLAILMEKLYKVKMSRRFMFFTLFPLAFIIAGIGVGGRSTNKQGAFSLLNSLLITGNAFLINVFSVPYAVERISKITYVLRSMGLKSIPYWLGNFIVDFSVKIIMALVILACVYIFKVDYLQDVVGQVIAIYLSFGFYMIMLSYHISLLSNNPLILMAISPCWLLAGKFYHVVLFISSGFFLPTALSELFKSLFDVYPLKVFYILAFIFLGPAPLLKLGLNTLVSPEYAENVTTNYAPFDQVWPYILLAIGMGLIFAMRVLYKDSRIYELREKRIYKINDKPAPADIEEDDVRREKERLKASGNKDLIKAVEVEKTYPNGFKALYDLSFGVEKGQIFCLLGPNGAGKTTSFEILTAKIPKTKGLVQLAGQSVSRTASNVFFQTGICSQTNTLWEFLTVEQHLRIYATLKGLNAAETNEVIQYFAKALQLEEYIRRAADKLSGGNKRKLCVALALIGGPKLVFLDEPSTGMDPIARNHLWTLIQEVMKVRQGAMVLTTHYMQEAELVGDKLGILINGRFSTIGSMTDLKKKFGEYSIVVYEEDNGIAKVEVQKLVESILPEAILQTNSEDRRILFKVPSNSMKFGKIFGHLEKLRAEKKIKDFSIFTTTLEQIFIKLAKQQRTVTEA